MGRKVKVELEADVAGFVRPVETAKKAVDDLGDKVDGLDRSLNKIPPDAAKAGAALKLLEGDVGSVSNKVNDLGEKNTGLAVLDSKIKDTRLEVRKLADEFVKTGDVDVFKKLGEAEGRLRGLQETRKKIADAIIPDNLVEKGEKAGASFFGGILSKVNGFGDSLSKMLPDAISGALSTPILGPVIAIALIAALLAAVTIVFASIGGLILAAGGAGLVGLGILGAILGDPKMVAEAWKSEISGIKDQFTNATVVFRGPLIDAAHEFGQAISSIDMNHIFGTAAKWVPELAHGAAEFARWLGVAAGYLTDGAGPVIQVIAQELPKIGSAIAFASAQIAGGSEGGAAALHDLFNAIEIVIAGLGGWIGLAEKVYDRMARFRDMVIPRSWFFTPDAPQHLDNAARKIGGVGDSAKSSATDLEALWNEFNNGAKTIDQWTGKIVNELFAATMGLDQATLSVAESQTRLQQTFEESRKVLGKHADQLNINTERGQANHRAVLAAVTANMQLYQAQLSAGMSAEDAAKAYGVNTAALEAQLQKAGLTKGQIDGLIGTYRGIPKRVDTEIAINGLESAIRSLNETIRLINGIRDKTVYVTVKSVGDNPRGQSRSGEFQALGGIRRAAAGMVVPPSDPGTVLFGEPQTGGEAFIPLRGIPQSRAMNLAQTVGDNYGFTVSAGSRRGGAITVNLAITGNGTGYTRLLAQTLQEMRRRGQLELTAS